MAKKTKAQKDLTHKKIKVAFISSIVTALVLVAAVCIVTMPERKNAMREERINEIFSQVFTPESGGYSPTGFPGSGGSRIGDSRTLHWQLVSGATVEKARSDIKQRAEKAGFKFDREESISKIPKLYFQNDKGEWLSVIISSKPRDDQMNNELVMGDRSNSWYDMNTDAAPSNVWVSISLDGNDI